MLLFFFPFKGLFVPKNQYLTARGKGIPKACIVGIVGSRAMVKTVQYLHDLCLGKCNLGVFSYMFLLVGFRLSSLGIHRVPYEIVRTS